MRRFLWAVLDVKRDMEDSHAGAYVAQSAYFIMLSFLPLIILLLSLIQFTSIGKAEVYSLIRSVIPVGFQSWLISVVDEMYSKTLATVSISALVIVWSAGKSFMALNEGMNAICGVEKRSNYFFMRLRGAFFALLFVALVVVSLLLIVFGYSIHGLLEAHFPFLALFTRVILSFRMVLMLGLFIVFFAALYMILPNRKAGLLEQFPGAIFSAAGWYLFSYGFSVYIEYSNAFNIYGSLTTLVLLMFWLYFVIYIIMIGLEINQWLGRRERICRQQ